MLQICRICRILVLVILKSVDTLENVHSVSLSFCLRVSLSVNGRMAIWLYASHLNYHSTIQPFTLKNIDIFYFEMSGQIAIQLFSIKKARQFLNSGMSIWPYISHLAIHTQTQTQTESEAFKKHSKITKNVILQSLQILWIL